MVEGSGSNNQGAARAKQGGKGEWLVRVRLELGIGARRKKTEEDRVERDLISTLYFISI